MDYRLPGDVRDALLADLDDLASLAGGILSRATRPRTTLRALEPWEPPRRVLYGANPYSSGRTPDVADILEVTGKYGTGAAVRLFDGSGSLNAAPVEASAGKRHVSWKCDRPGVISGALDAQVAAAVATLADGDVAEPWHEADVKSLDPAEQVLLRRAWASILDRYAPGVDQAFTIGGWRFEPGDSKGGPDQWADAVAECDLLGVDFDGTPMTYPFRDYRVVTERVLTWMDAHGFTRWAIPEWCVKDDGGHSRADYIGQHADYWATLGDRAPEYVCWFEHQDFGATTQLTLADEVAALSGLVAG